MSDNPLDYVIESEAEGRENMTPWSAFDCPEHMENRLRWAKSYCWHLYAHRGRKLRAYVESHDRLARLGIFDTGAVKVIERLNEAGIVRVEPGKIVLRRTLAGPLEQLAECAE